MSDFLSFAWLEANGFERVRDQPGGMQRAIGWELVSEDDRYLQDPKDLCLTLAPTGDPARWFCWLGRSNLPMAPAHTFIHVRYLTRVDELVRLYEGVTGRRWSAGSPAELGAPFQPEQVS